PIHIQFISWFGGILQGDFGASMWTGKPVLYEIGTRLELSLQIAIMATILAILIALPLGTLAAIFQNTIVDHVIRVISIAGLAIPAFLLVMVVFRLQLTCDVWIPPLPFSSSFRVPCQTPSERLWPATAAGYRYSAVATRMARSSILEVMQEDYI